MSSSLPFPFGNAICYSGFRDGQRPGGEQPTYEQIKEDLLILQGKWKYLRLYDCDPHTDTVIEVIEKEGLDFQLMLGAYIVAEASNPNNPWGAGIYTEEQLTANKIKNEQQIEKLIQLANAHADIVCSLSVGNEATVEWTDHLVPVESVINYTQQVQASTPHPVTFCENYVPWHNKLVPLAEVVDFISIHTYPVWEYHPIQTALAYTKENYYGVAKRFPNKPIVITEAGWATKSNGRGIPQQNVNEELQKIYFEQLIEWTTQEQIITFVFEAFDESWKGSPDPLEPEKHWGLYKVDRTPKLAMQ